MSRSYREGTRAHYRDARYYEQAYQKRRNDVRFYVDLAAELRARRVLELGVGTGRVALALARAGVEVVGVDLMPSMLEGLRTRLEREPASVRERVTLRTGDLRRFRAKERFPLVIAPFNVFMHLYDRSDWERALARVHEHLRPSGRLAFDVLLPDPFILSRPPTRRFTAGIVPYPSHGKRYRFFESYDYDAASQVQITTMQFVDGRGRAKVTTPLSQRQIFPAELEALLHYNGFRLDQLWGDFDRSPITNESPSEIVVARPVNPRRGTKSR
ncbi:MAG: class I SAM-dependent methyltransferase [Polyangiales bacterium]|nr:class I SAM-dependent methyltransferase [Myxococcales bacterium]